MCAKLINLCRCNNFQNNPSLLLNLFYCITLKLSFYTLIFVIHFYENFLFKMACECFFDKNVFFKSKKHLILITM